MAERTLRGARLGAQSFEDERGVEMAPRQEVEYDCSHGHYFTVIMATEAEVPREWECSRCGGVGVHREAGDPVAKREKPPRTHWDMLRERRSISELEEILTERLDLLRTGAIGPAHLHRPAKRRSA